jgi:peroxiredoxin Q/BCP
MIPEGSKAPEFTLLDQKGETVSLADLRGKWLAMWWFVKASTPG